MVLYRITEHSFEITGWGLVALYCVGVLLLKLAGRGDD